MIYKVKLNVKFQVDSFIYIIIKYSNVVICVNMCEL